MFTVDMNPGMSKPPGAQSHENGKLFSWFLHRYWQNAHILFLDTYSPRLLKPYRYQHQLNMHLFFQLNTINPLILFSICNKLTKFPSSCFRVYGPPDPNFSVHVFVCVLFLFIPARLISKQREWWQYAFSLTADITVYGQGKWYNYLTFFLLWL